MQESIRLARRGAFNLSRALWLALILIVVPSLALIGLEVYQVVGGAPALKRNHEWIVHTFQVIATAKALDRALQDAERAQRSYLITGDERYLDPYRVSSHEADGLLAKLKQLTADNPEQQRRLPDLERQIDIELAELKRTIDVRRNEGVEAVRDILGASAGLGAMHAIGGMLDAAIATEDALLTERLARVAEKERSTAATSLTSGMLASAIMILGVILTVLAFRTARTTEAARHQSEEHLRVLVNGIADHAICMLDPHGLVATWNVGAQRIVGYAADEILGQHFSRFFTEEDRKADLPSQALETALREGRFEAEAWRVRKDGSRFFANVVLDPLRDTAGKLLGFAKITRDITERLQRQQALEQARAQLAQSQKMEALGQLTGGIAHDFNNLLHVIKNCIQLLQRRLPNEDADAGRIFAMVDRNADRAARLTQQLLAFARRQPLELKPIDPNKLVSRMTDLLRHALGESVALETVLGSGAWAVSTDANQLESALLNLAVNARDAMPQGGKLTIETSNAFLDEVYVRAHEGVGAGQYVLIAVSDTGSGMTKDVIAQAFDPFFTTKQAGHGTGLGLSQVYGFVKQSGGHVKIYSEPGEGTTIKLYLPRLAMAQTAPAFMEEQPDAAAIATETVLVVEDDEDVRTFTAELLGELGYRVLAAPDARSALGILEKEPGVDLLFTDVGLPNGINGRQLADEARRRWPGLQVLFTTGYARNAIVHHGRLDPGVELIVKPFSQSTLAIKIRGILDKGNGT
jgi:PAS domain S-box-containing protein